MSRLFLKCHLKKKVSFRKSVTITAERLSDHSRITFILSSDKTIAHLRSLLNHHLPPQSSNRFHLYSYQRGALIHFHPPSFKLDYFPVIFDQSVLLLKMDDQRISDININNPTNFYKETKRHKYSFLKNFFPSKTTAKNSKTLSSSENITCLSIFKRIFHHRSRSTTVNTDQQKSVLIH